MAPYIEKAKGKLADNEQRINSAKELMLRSDKAGIAMSAAYLSNRDEIVYLLNEKNNLKNILISDKNRATRLIAPVYASDRPIAPKKRNIFAAGLFGDLF